MPRCPDKIYVGWDANLGRHKMQTCTHPINPSSVHPRPANQKNLVYFLNPKFDLISLQRTLSLNSFLILDTADYQIWVVIKILKSEQCMLCSQFGQKL